MKLKDIQFLLLKADLAEVSDSLSYFDPQSIQRRYIFLEEIDRIFFLSLSRRITYMCLHRNRRL